MRPRRNPELIHSLGLEIAAQRKLLGISQEELAGRCQVDRPFISLIEVGQKQPTLSVLYKLAAGLGLTFAEFADAVDKRYKAVTAALQAGDEAGTGS